MLYFFNPAQNGFYPRCLFKYATGLDCPGCGGLRATHQLLHGQIAAAFSLNPLMVLLLPLAVLLLINECVKQVRGRPLFRVKFSRHLIWVLPVLMIAYTILRNWQVQP